MLTFESMSAMGHRVMGELVVGERLDQYELRELLARSGMASIFKAVDTDTGALVALKIPHPQLESDAVLFERFKREEAVGQKLEHPNVVKVMKPRRKSRMYLAMELVDGPSLRSIIQTDGPLPAERALDIARQITAALIYLHDQGIVHRDIKPENILLTATGAVKILDFGIALDESKRRLTWTGLSEMLGTPDYMAPEQIDGRGGDPRSDVYAVGTVLYEMLTKNLPFQSTNAHALLRAKASTDPKPPSHFVARLDPALEAILLKALQRLPRDRYASARELLAELTEPTSALHRAPDKAPPPERRFPRISRRLLNVGLLLVVVVGGVCAAVYFRSRRHGPPSPSAAPR